MSDANAPFLHDASATVRFWIVVDGAPLGASVGSQAHHHRFRLGGGHFRVHSAGFW